MSELSLLEVGPRDGLQNSKAFLSLENKIEFIKKLSATGLKRIELGAFVSPQAIPQMKETPELTETILKLQNQGEISQDIQFSALVPNQKGLERALSLGLKEVAIFLACTNTFSQKNINCDINKSLEIYKEVTQKALGEGLKVRAYLSVCFSCPYEGSVPLQTVIDLCEKVKKFGVYEIAISDTVGLAKPYQVETLLNELLKSQDKQQIAFHFHNIHGMALSNVWAAYQKGIRSFDGSVGGLGGCPYAGVKTGNVSTESLVYLFEGDQSPCLKNLVSVARWLETQMNQTLPSLFIRSPYYKEK